ncbi:Ig-like domain-containing protein [Photorhabdus sp. RM71S]|uniref:Ig-like domain-containing protein n=1 Tax=Photorhabdus sp. RM71S TaxID=3342824 RepID=UPI0036DF2675
MKKTGKEQSENQNTIPTVNKIKDDSYVDGKDPHKKQTSMLETARYSISLSKDTDNQPADGKSLNQATATLLRNDSPYAGQVVFTLTGSAYFDDGSQNKTIETNSKDGKATVSFYDTKKEGETVTLSVAYPNDIAPNATDKKHFSFTPYTPHPVLMFNNVPYSMVTWEDSIQISISVTDESYLPCTLHVDTDMISLLSVDPKEINVGNDGKASTVLTCSSTVDMPSSVDTASSYVTATLSASILGKPSTKIYEEIKVFFFFYI